MKMIRLTMLGLICLGLFALGCENAVQPVHEEDPLEKQAADLEVLPFPDAHAAVPSPQVTVNAGAEALTLWPYTGTNFSGHPQDPVNLLFIGQADPRDIRAALLSLGGDRSALGFPPAPPFNQTWDDAIGDEQTGYAEPDGWTGSVIQLACGAYEQPRFHIRLFKAGTWTIASAHFEILIPGTTDHQVLSWELAEQFVTADFVRSGLLDPDVLVTSTERTNNTPLFRTIPFVVSDDLPVGVPGAPIIPTDQINDAPSFRTIPAIIYNQLPVELRALIGGPLGDVTEDVGIPTDGHAVILNLAEKAECEPGVRTQNFIVNFGQVVPKPFCSSGPGDYLYVEGPVYLQQRVHLTANGVYTMSFAATGTLTATPVNPLTGEPTGEPMEAQVLQRHASKMTNSYWQTSGLLYQKLGSREQEGSGVLFTRLQVISRDVGRYEAKIRCGSSPWQPLTKPAELLAGPAGDEQGDGE